MKNPSENFRQEQEDLEAIDDVIKRLKKEADQEKRKPKQKKMRKAKDRKINKNENL